jgi:hypothetical protein
MYLASADATNLYSGDPSLLNLLCLEPLLIQHQVSAFGKLISIWLSLWVQDECLFNHIFP